MASEEAGLLGLTPLQLAACWADGGAAAGMLLRGRPSAIAVWRTPQGHLRLSPAELSRLPPHQKEVMPGM